MSHVTEMLTVNLLGAVGCALLSAWMFRRRKVRQAEAIVFRQKIDSSRWLKFIPNVWLGQRFGPDPRSREWEVYYLVGVAVVAGMSLALFAVFVANLVQLFGAS